jgi:DNA-binding beta-propeller fold protein YncE
MNRVLALCLTSGLVAVTGCDSSEPCTVDCGAGPGLAEVFVANQGNFAAGNGSLGRFDPVDESVGSTAALGGLVQSAVVHNGRVYVTVNTGNRVDVFDADGLNRLAQIHVPAPRYVAVISDTKAYVTSQFYDFGPSVRPDLVTVINPQTGATVDSVQVGGNAEGMAIVGSRAYVTTGGYSDTQLVMVLDTATDAIMDTLDVGCPPRLALPDAQGDVFIICATGAGPDEVVVLDGATGTEEARIPVGTTATFGFGQDAYLAASENELYVAQADGTILRIDTESNTVLATLGPFGSDPIGAVAYDPDDDRLYVARAPAGFEFVSGGYVTVHDRTGTEVARFSSGGVAPSHLVLR